MSYYFAVWEGPAPLSNAHATSECDRLLSLRANHAPTPGIGALVEVLHAAYPEGDPGAAPWADGQPARHVDGPLAYLPVRPEAVDHVRPLLQDTAAARELVAFDPQLGELIPSATTVARSADFELPVSEELPLHLTAVIGEALGAGSNIAGILEQVATGYYVQWMAQNGSLTIEAQGEDLLAPQHRLAPEGQNQMKSIGFVEGDPNWRLHWEDGFQHLDQAGQILGHVLMAIRRLPVGTAMALQTFPV